MRLLLASIVCLSTTVLPSAMAETKAAPASAEAFVAEIQDAQGTEAYWKHSAVEAGFSVVYPGRVDLQGTILFDTHVGKSRIELKDGTVWVFDGKTAWIAPDSKQSARARFHLLTWPYFFAAAHKLTDPGTHLDAPEEVAERTADAMQPAVKLSFDPGTGDAPDDWYYVFQDEQHRLGALAYVVTYGKGAAAQNQPPSICLYEDFETQDGVTYPTAWSTWLWQPDQGVVAEKPKGKTRFTDVRFVTAPDDAFVKPEGATEDKLPGGG